MVARVCCLRSTGDRNRESSSRLKVKVAEEEENKYGTFTKLAMQGSGGVITGAQISGSRTRYLLVKRHKGNDGTTKIRSFFFFWKKGFTKIRSC